MKRFIQAILFDLGDTLMYSPNPWPPVFEQAGQALAHRLYEQGIEISTKTFPGEFRRCLDSYYEERERHLNETSTMTALNGLLARQGYPNTSDEARRNALDAFYAVTQKNWFLEEDAIATLSQLQEYGYRLGIVSNAGDNRDVFQLVEKFGIERYFDFVLTSAACSYRKPHPRIYEIALSHWGYVPDQAAMVGDRLDADINGSQLLGMYGIWITRRARAQNPHGIQPEAVVQTLREIPPLLSALYPKTSESA
jgi:putative hydrolase of the HAD superfamily